MSKLKLFFCKFISKINETFFENYKLDRFLLKLFNPYMFSFSCHKKDYSYKINDYNMKIRVFTPKNFNNNIIFYIHGGGFVFGSVSSYSRLCSNISKITKSIVISLEYRLAPEYPYPYPLNDCYLGIEAIINDKKQSIKEKNIFIMGDSAGANLAIGVSYLLKKNKVLENFKQILLYPVLNNNYTNYSRYPSVKKYDNNYVLTAKDMQFYIESYVPLEEDRINPLVCPLLMKDYSFLNNVLIIAAEYDILRDEGADFYKRLKEQKIDVDYKIIKKTIHGFYNIRLFRKERKETIKVINKFINMEGDKNE